jgi:Cleft lip and palate transmembrane protein 1 (CLPTM1)
MDVTIDRSGPLPRLRFKNRDSYQKSRTQEYDAQAMRYLSYVLYPLVSVSGPR